MARVLLGALAALFLVGAARADAAQLVRFETPSRFVDPATALFARGTHTDALRTTVLLPDGYDGTRRFPVLYLIHPTNGDDRTWSQPGEGDAAALGLDAIVVMPDVGLGFLSDWFSDGRRCCPGWERYFLDELVPAVERRFRVLPGRRWHAIGGFSMGGGGAAYLASQRPGYFGTVVSLSGTTLSIQRPYTAAAFPLAVAFPYAVVRYESIWGPSSGAYATGHNPLKLVDNLRSTRLFASAGDGVPRPGVALPPGPTGSFAIAFDMVIEREVRFQSDEFTRAARAAGASVDYVTHDGIHDWPYVRADLRAAVGWGLFGAVPVAPEGWTYRTVAQSGEAWGLRYAFAAPPAVLETLRRDGERLTGSGSGTVTVTGPGGCVLTASLPFAAALPC